MKLIFYLAIVFYKAIVNINLEKKIIFKRIIGGIFQCNVEYLSIQYIK